MRENVPFVTHRFCGLHARWWKAPKAPPLDWLLHPTQDFAGLLLNGFVRVTKVGLAAMGLPPHLPLV